MNLLKEKNNYKILYIGVYMAHLKTVSATTKNWSELPSDVIVVGVFSKGE